MFPSPAGPGLHLPLQHTPCDSMPYSFLHVSCSNTGNVAGHPLLLSFQTSYVLKQNIPFLFHNLLSPAFPTYSEYSPGPRFTWDFHNKDFLTHMLKSFWGVSYCGSKCSFYCYCMFTCTSHSQCCKFIENKNGILFIIRYIPNT